jgi:hypothetical protein
MVKGLFIFVCSLAWTIADSAVVVNISGASDSPLTVTFPNELIFTNVPVGLDSYGLVITGAVSGESSSATSTHTGIAAWGGTGNDSGTGGFMGIFQAGDVTYDDLFINWSGATGNQGPTTSTMSLSAGFRVSDSNLNFSVAQGNNSYTIRMFDPDGGGLFIGDAAVAVPEPSQVALVLALLTLGFVAFKRRRMCRDEDAINRP